VNDPTVTYYHDGLLHDKTNQEKMKFTSQAILFFLATLYTCGVYGKQQDDQQRNLHQRHSPEEHRSLTAARIIGGNTSPPGKYPYYVLMGVGDNGGCGASLIAPRVVLTAAHCKPKKIKGKEVTVGPSNRYSLKNGSFQKAEKIRVTKTKSHPNYVSRTNENDYALLLLENAYVMDSDIQLVLNENTNVPLNKEMLDALGMGQTKDPDNGPETAELRDVKVPAMTNNECRKYYGSDVKNNMLCAGYKEGKKNICYGDSGGPLVKVDGNEHIQVGIASFVGEKCAGKNSPGGYARVSEGINWMRGVICNEWKVESSLCGPSPPTPPSEPTPAPASSPSPTSDCSDTSGFFKVGKKKKKCNWAKKKRKQKCKKKVKNSGGKRVWEFCPVTCDKC